MWEAINAALKGIVDLLKLRKDVRKTDLEIGKLEREEKKASSLIHVASTEEVIQYDPKVQEIFKRAKHSIVLAEERAPNRKRRLLSLGVIVCFGLVIYYFALADGDVFDYALKSIINRSQNAMPK